MRNARLGPRPSIASALERDPVVWLSSVRPDGSPHLLPLWFTWDGDTILVYSKPGAQKVRNLRASPRVMVAVGAPTPSFDVELIEAVAELEPPATERLPETFRRKYAGLMARAGITAERFAAVYSQPIRIRPTRWLGWGGPGWPQADAVAARPVAGAAVSPT
jgi:PPOX class probable F420-dependent enzyme